MATAEPARTVEEVEKRMRLWNAGVGPDELHDALGWTAEELAAYKVSGGLPHREPLDDDQQPNPFLEGIELDAQSDADLEGPITRLEGRALERDAPWMFYTRWRPKPTGSGKWKVMGEHGEEDAEGPRQHDSYNAALRRADELNASERENITRREITANTGGA